MAILISRNGEYVDEDNKGRIGDCGNRDVRGDWIKCREQIDAQIGCALRTSSLTLTLDSDFAMASRVPVMEPAFHFASTLHQNSTN